MTSIITRPQFIQWLNNHTPKQIVGQKCHNKLCPIAAYLKVKHPESTWSIFSTDLIRTRRCRVHSITMNVQIDLPGWAARFIRAVDTSRSKNVTAQTALKLLDGIEA